MKGIHKNKLGAVLEMKGRALFSKNFIIMPLFSIGITLLLKFLYQSMGGNGSEALSNTLLATALGMGAVMNITMTGILCTGMALAEEKEKHTLRALMTSSVNGLEFFLGSILPVVAMMLAVNAMIMVVAGVSLSLTGWALWLGMSLLCATVSGVLGMILGICAKDQVTASTVSTVPMLILVLVPSFRGLNATLNRIGGLLFTGVLQNMIQDLVEGKASVDVAGLGVILGEIVLAVGVFLYVYRKNGYDAG